MDPVIQPVSDHELEDFFRAEGAAFGIVKDQSQLEREKEFLELDRAVAVHCDGGIVATAGAHSLELTLPGLRVEPAAGVAYVGVLPTHRRRGMLTAMMRHQLDDVHGRGECLAILTASEGSIYGRFGYGPATFVAAYSVDRQGSELAVRTESHGAVSLVDSGEAAKVLAPVHDGSRRARPGDVGRPDHWWPDLLRDDERRPGGANGLFVAVHADRDGEVDGYAMYRVGRSRGHESQDGQSRTVSVRELVASGLEPTAALWGFLAGIDLTERVELRSRPLDEPVRWMLADPRRLRTVWQSDHLWVRLVDIPSALSRRGYPLAGRLVLDVEDDLCPWNRGLWRLDARPDGAEVERAGRRDRADLAVGASELASAYLGGVRLSTLVASGRAGELVPGAARVADLLFCGGPEPFCATDF